MSVRSRPRGVGGPHRAAPRSVGGLDGRGWDPGTSLSLRTGQALHRVPRRCARPPADRKGPGGEDYGAHRELVLRRPDSHTGTHRGWANLGDRLLTDRQVSGGDEAHRRENQQHRRYYRAEHEDGGEGEQDPKERPERHEVEDARVPGPEKIGEPRGEQQRPRQPAQERPRAPPWAAHHSHKAPASVGTTASSGQRGGAIGPASCPLAGFVSVLGLGAAKP